MELSPKAAANLLGGAVLWPANGTSRGRQAARQLACNLLLAPFELLRATEREKDSSGAGAGVDKGTRAHEFYVQRGGGGAVAATAARGQPPQAKRMITRRVVLVTLILCAGRATAQARGATNSESRHNLHSYLARLVKRAKVAGRFGMQIARFPAGRLTLVGRGGGGGETARFSN